MLQKTEEEKRTLEKVRVQVSFKLAQNRRISLLLIRGGHTVYLNLSQSAISSFFSPSYSVFKGKC